MSKQFNLLPPPNLEKLWDTLDNLYANAENSDSRDARSAAGDMSKAMDTLSALAANTLLQALHHYEETQDLSNPTATFPWLAWLNLSPIYDTKFNSLTLMHEVAKKLHPDSKEWKDFFQVAISNTHESYTIFTESPEARVVAAIYSTLEGIKQLVVEPKDSDDVAEQLFSQPLSSKKFLSILKTFCLSETDEVLGILLTMASKHGVLKKVFSEEKFEYFDDPKMNSQHYIVAGESLCRVIKNNEKFISDLEPALQRIIQETDVKQKTKNWNSRQLNLKEDILRMVGNTQHKIRTKNKI